jgi:thiamine kinase-like enzyme
MTLEAEVRAALRQFPEGHRALAAGYRHQSVGGGAVNRLVRVTSSVGDWAVRLGGPHDEALIVNRVSEHRAQVAAARLGVAPAIVHADPRQGILISEWIEAPIASVDLFRTQAGLYRIAQPLRRLHSSPLPSELRVIDGDLIVEGYLAGARAGSGPVPLSRLQAAAGRVRSRHKSPNLLFCHNDLHHLNVLDGARIWFLDWEYAGAGDPLFDLAAIVSYHDLTVAQSETLLAAYGRYTCAELAPWVVLFDVIHALWLDAADAWDSLTVERRTRLLHRLEA